MTDALESLPDRPLKEEEIAALNHSDPVDLAVPVDREDAVTADTKEPVVIAEEFILGTENWVKALAYDGGWRAIESVAIDDPDEERFAAMRACEDAIREYRD